MSTVALQKTAQVTTLNTVSDLLNKYKEQIAMALPRHLTPERMIRVALTAVSRSEKLQKCSPATIAGCVVQASILGLEPDGVLGEAYLVPFWNSKAANGKGGKGAYECQLQPGYQGLIKLVRNTGELKMIDVQEVCANDEFDFEKGMDPYLRHKPAAGDRGEVLKIWAGAVLTNGGKQFEVMTLQEIEDHRDKYSKGAFVWENGRKVTDSKGDPVLQGPWRDSPEWMYKKTVLRKLVKLLPKSAQAQLAVALDERAEIGIPQRFTVDVPIELQQSDASDPDQVEGEPIKAPQRLSEVKSTAEETPTETAEQKKAREAAEVKNLRKSLKERYSEDLIEKHTGGRDINAIKDLDTLVELSNALAESV
jgi:recombination protein RecT